jgi:hypothetical protein
MLLSEDEVEWCEAPSIRCMLRIMLYIGLKSTSLTNIELTTTGINDFMDSLA